MINVLGDKDSKIIESEADENVRVTRETYKKLFQPGGSWCTIILIQITMCLFVVCNIGSSFYI